MAAEYGININVRTRTEALKRLQGDLKNTDAFFQRILKKINDPALKGRVLEGFKDKVAKLRNEVIILNNGFVNNTNRVNDSAKTLRLFSAQLNDARKNTKLFSGEYKVLTQGIQKADFTARFKDLKEFSRKAAITAGNLGGAIPMARGTSFEDLMAFRPTQTRKAINEYLGFLRDLEAKLDRTSDRFKEVTQRIREMERELNSPVIANATAYSQPIGPRQAMAGENFFNRTFGRNRQFQRGGMFFEPGGFASRRRNALSSGLIGGAFPLLFGQGLGASVGGGLGGVSGGFLGGGLGFGLSLVGTQVGAQLDKLAQSAMELGKALRNPIENIDLLIQKLGAANTPFADTVATLKSLGLEAVAAQQVLDQFNNTFGTNKKTLDSLSEESIRFENELQKLGTGMSLFIAGPLTFFLEKINRALGFQTVSGLKTEAQSQAVKEARAKANAFNQPGGKTTGNPILDFLGPGRDLFGESFAKEGEFRDRPEVKARAFEIFEQEMNKIGLGGTEKTRNFANEDLQKLIKERRDFELSTLQSQLEIQQKSLTFRNEDLDVLKKRIDLAKINEQIAVKEKNLSGLLTDEARNQVQFELNKLNIQRQISKELLNQSIIMADPVQAALVNLNKEMEKFNDMRFQAVEFAKAFSGAFENSFKGIIKGTMSVQDAFRNMFMRIADHFLDMAAQMMAAQVRLGIMKLFGNMFGNNFTRSTARATPTLTPEQQVSRFTFGRAEGGPVKGGGSYIVGERGPELFSPGVSGMITPNEMLGGSTNIVVNVDASGSSVEGDAEQSRELGRLISVAVQSEIIQQQRPGGLLA